MHRYAARPVPSSFRIYFNANDRPVSFLSTIRTFPKAPLPTTRSRRKWFKFTARNEQVSRLLECRPPDGQLTLAVEIDGFSLTVAHVRWFFSRATLIRIPDVRAAPFYSSKSLQAKQRRIGTMRSSFLAIGGRFRVGGEERD